MASKRNVKMAEIIVFDVGLGDCLHIQVFPGIFKGETSTSYLVDTGRKKRYAYIHKKLEQLGKTVEYIVLTHEHGDHIAGCEEFLKAYDVKKVMFWLSGSADVTNKKNIISAISTRSEKIIQPYDTKNTSKYFPDFKVLYPFDKNLEKNSDPNHNSIVLQLCIGKNKMLLMGDGTKREEKLCLNKYNDDIKESSLIKIGHHGSNTSSDRKFLEAFSQEALGIVSCSDSKSPPPHMEMLDLWQEIKQRKLEFTEHQQKRNSIKIVVTREGEVKFEILS